MSFITSYCRISHDRCTVNGEMVASRKFTEDTWLRELYKETGLSYPKFYKMDQLAQAGFLAFEALRKVNPDLSSYRDDAVAMVFANSHSSADTDQRFQKTYQENTAPSPALFVYTLPNIVLGEIAILNKWYGENMFAVLPNFAADFFVNYGNILLSGNTEAVLGGWLDILDDKIEIFLFFVETKAGTGIDFTAKNLACIAGI
ncbi:hypothetical protein DYBT9275_01531 [Dyadobacter sp. CECT 9275]|uniref:3-oxoacyl-ACP synthase n=1 Tax=Dyadobacter helix TaxID=2822344 RepID=A0A916JBE2_9BACT|nr:hypothetical protein [Dyadobacter sp. CECT 9275]CAG4995041.1 hypothetical protein DYBT9275_01531 [Dyadobacter sp. CECT 9275]